MFTIVLPPSEISVFWPGIIILGILIGFLTGMYGVGGGFLLTPFLKILFGIPYPLAVGCSLALIFFNSAFAAAGHWKKKSVDPLLGSILAMGALLGAEVGIKIIQFLSSKGVITIIHSTVSALDLVLNCTFIIIMLLVCISILIETAGGQQKSEITTPLSLWQRKIKFPPVLSFKHSNIERMSFWVPFVCSLIVGVFIGLLGIGGGFIYLPLLVYVIGTPTLIAVGTSSFQMIFSSAYGAFRYFSIGNVNFIIVALLLIGSLAGVKLGVNSAYYFGSRKIRKSFVFVVTVGIIVILLDIARDILH